MRLKEGIKTGSSQVVFVSDYDDPLKFQAVVRTSRRTPNEPLLPLEKRLSFRLLREKIGSHDIMFSGDTLDLGGHDEREDI